MEIDNGAKGESTEPPQRGLRPRPSEPREVNGPIECALGPQDLHIEIRRITVGELTPPELLPGWLRLGTKVEFDGPCAVAVFVDQKMFTVNQ